MIPKPIRDSAGLRPGLELDVEYRDGVVELQPVSRVRLVRKGNLLVGAVPRQYRNPPLTNAEVNRIIRDLRERRRPF